MKSCKCGCKKQLQDTDNHSYNRGHKPKIGEVCECGRCGLKVVFGRKFISGHNIYGTKQTEETRRKIGLTHKNKTVSEETKEKISKRNTGKIRSKEARQRSSEITKKQWEQGIHNNNVWICGESYPEKVFREYLETLGAVKNVDFFQEYKVGRYHIDFAYIDEQGKRGIEIDGSQHLKPEAIQRDKIRDEWLTKQGWTMYRIPVKELYPLLDKYGNNERNTLS